jgi:hypothetical protein
MLVPGWVDSLFDYLCIILVLGVFQGLCGVWIINELSYREGAELCEKLERSCVIHSDAEGVSVLELQKQLRRMRGYFHHLEFALRKQSTLKNFFTSGSHDSDMLD